MQRKHVPLKGSLVYHSTKTALRSTRVAHADSLLALVLSFKELQAPILDDEAWLSDVQYSEKNPREVPLVGNTQLDLCVWTTNRLHAYELLAEILSSSDDDKIS
eukprot:2255741-Amphidinium_carterae.1